LADYIETGQAKLDFRYFPLTQHDPGATLGAMAVECAADQGAFWPYHDKLFAAAAAQGAGGFTPERLIDYAVELDLDQQQFTQCLATQEHQEYVQNSRRQAVEMGLNSTPSVLVNGELLSAPFDYDALTAEVERQLESSNRPIHRGELGSLSMPYDVRPLFVRN